MSFWNIAKKVATFAGELIMESINKTPEMVTEQYLSRAENLNLDSYQRRKVEEAQKLNKKAKAKTSNLDDVNKKIKDLNKNIKEINNNIDKEKLKIWNTLTTLFNDNDKEKIKIDTKNNETYVTFDSNEFSIHELIDCLPTFYDDDNDNDKLYKLF